MYHLRLRCFCVCPAACAFMSSCVLIEIQVSAAMPLPLLRCMRLTQVLGKAHDRGLAVVLSFPSGGGLPRCLPVAHFSQSPSSHQRVTAQLLMCWLHFRAGLEQSLHIIPACAGHYQGCWLPSDRALRNAKSFIDRHWHCISCVHQRWLHWLRRFACLIQILHSHGA